MFNENRMEQQNSYELLNKIDSPSDLRKLPVTALPEVCAELRNKIETGYYPEKLWEK